MQGLISSSTKGKELSALPREGRDSAATIAEVGKVSVSTSCDQDLLDGLTLGILAPHVIRVEERQIYDVIDVRLVIQVRSLAVVYKVPVWVKRVASSSRPLSWSAHGDTKKQYAFWPRPQNELSEARQTNTRYLVS